MRLLTEMARRLVFMLLAGFAAALLTMPAAAQSTAAQPAATVAKSGPIAPLAPTTDHAYVLGPDDTISVSVYGQSDAGVQTRIKPDGTIVMPLIGNVQAAGQTVVSLADLITKKFVAGNYFKAGVYTQSNCTRERTCAPENFGEVVIYRLTVTHQQG